MAKVKGAAPSAASMVNSLLRSPALSLHAMRTPSVIFPKVRAMRPAPSEASRTLWFTHSHSPSDSS